MTDNDSLATLGTILEQAGQQALGYFNSMAARTVDAKSPGDLVSDADREVENTLRRLLGQHFPDCDILGEEFGGTPSARFWAIDPIDGTSNFLSGLPFWTISVGLMVADEPVMGGIIAPTMGLAAVGQAGGPFVATGFTPGSRPEDPPCIGIGRNPRWHTADRHAIEAAIDAADLGPRLLGSCALSLLLVATGRLKGYIEARVGGLWDCAGGLALCRAAGVQTAFKVHPDGTVDVLAGDVFDLARSAGWRGEILSKS
ncbi:inositol monophosphatase family protein [Tabrizicola sp.]|uniref:inositol monophosphatase family protein n=1 Tax=Tabrizicola sp. TaxID=2005166 RepID=UPI003F3AD52E